MKKITLMATLAVALVMASCGSKSAPEPVFETKTLQADSLAYVFGELNGYDLRAQVDSAYLDDFIRGFIVGAEEKLDSAELAYAQGLLAAQQYRDFPQQFAQYFYDGDSTKALRYSNIIAGVINTLKNAPAVDSLQQKEYTEKLNYYQEQLGKIQEEKNEREFADWKAENETYLTTNAENDSVKVLPSGVQYKVLVEGTGELPTDSTVVNVIYEGRTIDGNVFDSTEFHGGEPFEVNMANPGVVAGWVEALKAMPAGSKWEVTIPQELGYGAQGSSRIKPYSTLIFVMEVK